MKTPHIKFSHAYAKLADGNSGFIRKARLIQVLSVTIEELTKDFLDYDTDFGKYSLAFDTLYVILLFQKPNGDLFTTVRPKYGRFGNKQEYYTSLTGQVFDIIITEPMQTPVQLAKTGFGNIHDKTVQL